MGDNGHSYPLSIRCEKDGASVKASYDLQVPVGGLALIPVSHWASTQRAIDQTIGSRASALQRGSVRDTRPPRQRLTVFFPFRAVKLDRRGQ